MSRRVIRIELYTSLKFPGRLGQLQVTKKHVGKRGMSFTERIVQLSCFFCRRFCARIIFPRRTPSVNWNQCAAVGNSCVSESVTWVLLNGLLKVAESFLKVLTGPPVPEITSLQVELKRFQTFCRVRRDRALFRTGE